MRRLLRVNMNNLHERNAWFLVVEMFWASILGSAATFNAAFALRLEATNTQVAWLSSIPALLAVLVSLPAGRFLSKKANRKPWLLWTLALYRASFLMIAVLPWLPISKGYLGILVIGIMIGFTPLAHFFNIGWIPLLSEVIPEANRASVITARNVVYNATLSIFVFLFGQWLERIKFPINYQAMYIFGFLCTLLSLYFIIKIEVPPSSVTSDVTPEKKLSLPKRWNLLRQTISEHQGFVRISINTLLHGIGVWAALPLYVLYYVRQLGAGEGWLGLNSTIATSFTIAGWVLWRWVISRWGEPKTLQRTIILVGLYPVLVGLMPSLTPILFITALNGLVVPGVNLSHFNTLLKMTPESNRPGYTAAYVTIANTGAFICPLIGVAIANQVGLAPTLVGCGILSILGSTSFWWWPVRGKEWNANKS